MRKTLVAIALIFGMIGLTACNTIAGAGRDLESVGDTVEDAAT